MQTLNSITILMLPWLAHGHISPYFELAKKLAARNFTIHICSTPVNLTSIRSKLPEKISPSSSIQLEEIHLDPLPELPPQRHTTNGLPPHLMPTLKAAFDGCGPKLDEMMEKVRPDLVVYDFLVPWAPEVAKARGVPAVCFTSVSAGMLAYVVHALQKLNGEEVEEFPFEGVYLEDATKHVFEKMMEASSGRVKDKDRFLQCVDRSTDILLMKTFRELEGKYIDYLSGLIGKKVVPVGPLVQDPVNDLNSTHIIEWLDKKPTSSTIFVSFGTEYFLSGHELEDIALGLELSSVDFIWVVRFPNGEKPKLNEVLPLGFLERVRGRGLVIEHWAPQTRVLSHESIGGFVSHCGWSSVMESMTLGVPIIAMAMQLDQPLNAKVVEEVGVGIEVNRNPKSGRFEKEEIGRVMREVVVGSGGERVRRRVKEVSESIRRKGGEEIDGVAEEFVKILRGGEEEI